MLIVLAALPREIASLVRGVPADREVLVQGVHRHRLPGAIVVAAGMGGTRVAAAFAAAASVHTGGELTVVSAGLAGACTAAFVPGQVVHARVVIDARTGERATTSDSSAHAVLVSTDAIASVREKARLAGSYHADAVDMEAATVARLAAGAGARFLAIKAISDAHDFELQSLSRFATPRGHFRTGAFALHTALRPHRWPQTMRLGRHSAQALAALTLELQALIARER